MYVGKLCVRIAEGANRRFRVPEDFTLLAFQTCRDSFVDICIHVRPDESFSNEFDSRAFTRV